MTCWPHSLIFAAGLVLLSFASGIAGLAVAWIVIGIGMGFGLYEAAFATAAGLYGQEARNAITGITLFAGFASTIGWPASAAFIYAFGWRGGCLAWAGLHLLVGLPLNRLLVPKALPPPAAEQAPDHAAPAGVPWTMIVLAGVFGATWFVSTVMATHLPRLLEALGATPVVPSRKNAQQPNEHYRLAVGYSKAEATSLNSNTQAISLRIIGRN